MLKSVTLLHFQGHMLSELKLSPGINVIAGQSDAGKSSIVRALLWLATNRPRGGGDVYRHHRVKPTAEVSVGVVLEDDTSIVRFKQGQKNGYVVDAVGDLLAVRDNVPEQVQALLNMGEHSIQAQHQPYFLLADSPADVARKLNEVCGLDIIDACLSNAAKVAGQEAHAKRAAQATAEKLHADLQAYKGLDKLGKQVVRLGELESDLRVTTSAIARVEQLVAEAGHAGDQVADAQEFRADVQDVLARLDVYEHDLKVYDAEIKSVQALYDDGARAAREVTAKESRRETLEAQFVKLLSECDVCPFCEQEVPHGAQVHSHG